MLYPKLPEGKSITIGGRHKARKAVGGPGMIYDIHVSDATFTIAMSPLYSC